MYLTKNECENWCRGNGIDLLALDTEAFKGYEKVETHIPVECKRQTILIENLVELIKGDKEYLVWVRDWPLYRPLQLQLYGDATGRTAVSKTLIDFPGQIVISNQIDSLAGMLLLLVAFEWEAYLFSKRNKSIVLISHHCYLSFFSENSLSVKKAKENFARG